MRGMREPLLWIALAALAASLPVATVGMPACAALALSIQLLMQTRLGDNARGPLRLAQLATWLTCLLYASVLGMQMLKGSTVLPHRAAELSMPIALFALATALGRMAEVAAIEESELWLSSVRVLFLGGLAIDLVTGGAGFVILFLACPIFSVLVLRMRSRIALPNVR